MKYSIVYICCIVFQYATYAQGSVYLVLGSDTGIWDGMNVANYYCTYNLALFNDPAMNAYTVMNPAFRQQFRDSYGQPMKMTWWLMAGNLFRYATNKDVPVPNSMTMYLMNKYHGENARINGDELSLHYHTFTWTDYDLDGRFFWNQAKTFTDFKDDFDFSMAQNLLDENIFPVSYRSGWHYMDNDWQNYIDGLIPYSLHNDFPHVRSSVTEPIDNVYDWSRSSKEYVPFHPSLNDYQVPGNGKSWETRSIYMASLRQSDMDAIFLKALNGVDQVPCLWAHLPEADFPANMKRIDSLAHISAQKYPTVKFSYCTAIEAMQRWRKGTDTTPPVLSLSDVPAGENVSFSVQSSEAIFQTVPFVAVKDDDGNYTVEHCISTGSNQWATARSFPRSRVVKVGAAVTDTMGNLATVFLNFVPDDIYLDNLDPVYSETAGSWISNSLRSWGTNSRQCVLGVNDTAVVRWKPLIPESRLYSIFMQVPAVQNSVTAMTCIISSDQQPVDTVRMTGPFTGNDWIYITTAPLTHKTDNTITMTAYGNEQSGKVFTADAIKLSAIMRERQISAHDKVISPAAICEDDTAYYMLRIDNRGINDLTISEMVSTNATFQIGITMPVVIPGMHNVSIPLRFYSAVSGEFPDTLIVKSDDPAVPILSIPVQITVVPYFAIVDNDDSLHYSETGPWAKSVAQRWGPTSRYSPSGKGAYAVFRTVVKKSGHYEVFEIVPTTLNAVTNALYTITSGDDTLGSVVIDQNAGSGNWVSLGKYILIKDAPVSLTVADKGPSNSFVLRADAVKFQFLSPTSAGNITAEIVSTYSLEQNYPNPFNPVTTITWSIPPEGTGLPVSMRVYDVLGREVAVLINDDRPAGTYAVTFDASRFSSGVYYYQLRSGSFVSTRKMVLAK